MEYNGTQYVYALNLQGDVMAILNTSGQAVVEYTYDAWGNYRVPTGSMKDTLGQINPLRYRGYVYDRETGLYYLQSRYYDPEIRRFISADKFVSTGQGILGHNMYAYCGNNPTTYVDYKGEFFERTAGGGGGLAYAGPAGGHIYRPTTPVYNPIGIPFIPLPPTTTYGIDSLRAEKFAIKKKKKKQPSKPKKPEVDYPGDDPTKSPGDDYDWHGNKNEPVGSDKGAWVNEKTGEQYHPDLNHKPPKGPHWDYTDQDGYVWSLFPDGRIIIWE